MRRNLFRKSWWAGMVSGICFGAILNLPAAVPRIDYIEIYLQTNVLIHFDTEANRTYTLQYTETLPGAGTAGGNWTNLYVAPSIPFSNHYIIVDTALRPRRFYRLMASP